MAKNLKQESHRIGNLELRTVGKHLLTSSTPTTMEITIKEHSSNYTIAYWIMGSEGFDLKFVGGRPFIQSVDRGDFMQLAAEGQKGLDEYFDTMEDG